MALSTSFFAALSAVSVVAVVFAIGALLERTAAVKAAGPISALGVNVGYGFFSVAIGALLDPTVDAVALAIVAGCGGGLIALPDGGPAVLGSVLVFFLATDFLDYLWHRAQHAVPFLWAMHSLHHSDPAVNVTTGTRHFWLEAPMRAVFVYPLVGILFHVTPAIYVLYGVAKIYDFVQHLNVRASFGPFWTVLGGPQYHRIHHSTLPEHSNRNFAHFFPLFDIVFGTHHRPGADEYPPTGLDTGEVPTLLQAIVWPLRRLL